MSLRAAQQLVWRLVTGPEGVRAALEESAADARALTELIEGDDRLSAPERLEVYATAYFVRIHDALAEDYAALAWSLGADPFHDLVTSYLAVRPPRHPSLRFAGEALPSFLADHAAAEPFRHRWAWAPDLARLDWALVDAFDAPDATPAVREDFARVAPERWADLHPVLDASVQLLDLAWPAHTLRGAFERNESPPEIAAAPTPLCVWRSRERVRYRALDALEAEALAGTSRGASFGETCEQAAATVGEVEAPARAAAWFGRWVEDGLIVSPSPGAATG
ncbi:MAG: DNA-binding domain-containing protein [Proteobacteria bacterium]|nr:DNA-binding domain-containing protein [Pseudomonadota bacterium]